MIAGDVSLAREPPGPSSILNVIAWRASRLDAVRRLQTRSSPWSSLGADGAGARLLSRLTRKSWELLGLAEGVNVYAQVKAVALGPGRGDFGV